MTSIHTTPFSRTQKALIVILIKASYLDCQWCWWEMMKSAERGRKDAAAMSAADEAIPAPHTQSEQHSICQPRVTGRPNHPTDSFDRNNGLIRTPRGAFNARRACHLHFLSGLHFSTSSHVMKDWQRKKNKKNKIHSTTANMCFTDPTSASVWCGGRIWKMNCRTERREMDVTLACCSLCDSCYWHTHTQS